MTYTNNVPGIEKKSGMYIVQTNIHTVLHCKPVSKFSWKCLWCVLQGVIAHSSMSFCWLTARLEPLPIITTGKEEALLTKWLTGKKRKQHGVFGSIQSSFVSNHHPHPLDTSLSSNSHFFHQPSWQNTVVIVDEKTQVFLINIWKSICTSVLDWLLPDWWQRLPQVDPCSRQVYLCWCDRFLSGSKKFCQVCHESVGEVQRACLLTSLMYQPWHSQFVHNLKNRWSRAGNET